MTPHCLRLVVVFLSVTLNCQYRERAVAIKLFEFRTGFDAVGQRNVSSCACAFNFGSAPPGSSSSSRNEYDLGGTIALLL